MRNIGCLVLFALAAFALANVDGYHIRDGSSCRALNLGDGFNCAPLGGRATTRTLEEGDAWPFTPCAALEQCRVSSSNFTVFSVSHEDGLSIMGNVHSSAFVTANATHATVVGALEDFIFRNEDTHDHLRLLTTLSNGSYLTTVGCCDFGVTYTRGGFTFSASAVPSVANLTKLEATVAAKAMGLGGASFPVTLALGPSYAFSATSETDFFVTRGVTVAEAELANVVASVPPRIAITDLSLTTDEDEYNLAATFSNGDFEAYEEVPCREVSAVGDGVECEFPFSASFAISTLTSHIFSSFSFGSFDSADLSAEEEAFALFE